jgi:hypothetical protein
MMGFYIQKISKPTENCCSEIVKDERYNEDLTATQAKVHLNPILKGC